METNKPVAVITVTETIEKYRKGMDEAHEDFIKEVKSTASDYAIHCIPEQTAPSLEQYIEPIRATYDRILNETALHLGAAIRNQLGAMDIFSLKQRIKDLKLKANAFSNQLDALLTQRKKSTGQRTWKEYERLELKLNVFAVIESIGYVLSFLALGDSWGLSLVWGIITGILQTTGIKSLVLWLRDGSGASLSKPAKYMVWGGVALVATGLGLLRFASTQTDANSGFAQSALAPFVFILISYFLISVLALYVWNNYPTKEELAAMKKAASLDGEIAAKEKELRECQQQIQQLNEDCNTLAQVHTLLIQASKDFYHRVNSHFLYAVGIFKSTNRVNRTDNVTPECFAHPVVPLAVPNYDAWEETEINSKQIAANV